jgi:transposase
MPKSPCHARVFRALGCGKSVIISSEKIPNDEILPLYYTRQSAENLFGISKSFLDILPIRTHSIETFRGYLMLNFLALIVYIEMKNLLHGEFTVEGALLEMTNLMCKIY